MKYNGIIQRKLAILDNHIQELRLHTNDIQLKEFKESWLLRRMSERVLQISAEILIDIAERIIALENAGPVASASEAMDKLHTLGIIKSSEPYRSIVKFRNLIVHQYDEIDPELVYSIIKNNLDDFYRFRDEIDIAGKPE